MLLCSYSSKLALDGYTVLDNNFINEFLPSATGDDVKVYLFGLGLCSNPNTEENNMDTISKVLSMTETQVLESFSRWQDVGLVQIVSKNPVEIKYLPVRTHSGSMKIRNKEKYSDFNKQMQEIITGRMITPMEFNEYYSLIEVYHFEPEAVVLIAKYCTTYKNDSIGYQYILSVARNFASEGLKTFEAVEEKFLEQERTSKELKQILNAMGLRREPSIEERGLYLKWVNNFGFTQGVLVEIAKSLKGKGGTTALDELIKKYYEQKLLTIEEITSFSSQRDEMFEIAKTVAKNLGLYYGNFEIVVDTYVMGWLQNGYDKDTLAFLSKYCFKQSIRTLEGFNTIIQKLYKLGLISLQSIEQYISAILENDEKIKEVLSTFGLLRQVTNIDRDNYKMWTANWGFEHNQILLIAKAYKDKSNPMSYLNRMLSALHDEGIHQTEEIEKRIEYFKPTAKSYKKSKDHSKDFESRNYSQEELAAVFDSLDNIEVI